MGLSLYDIAGFITGAICVWLVVRNNIWNFAWGIVNSAIFLVSFLLAGLYADSALQVVYIVLGVYGWWAWLYAGPDHHALPMRHISRQMTVISLMFIVVATIVFATILADALGSTVPFWDGLTTSLSLAAQYLLTRKIYENWYLWIAADIVYVPLYVSKHLPLTGALYVIFLGMCVAGLIQWRTVMHRTATA
jgi:nicotinamide mononucleotide transporter